MNELFDVAIYILVAIAVVVILSLIVKAVYDNSPLVLSKLSTERMYSLIYKYAVLQTTRMFSKDGRPTHTKKGGQRVDFKKAIDKKYNEICDEIVYKGDFTDVFYTFVEKHITRPRKKDFNRVVSAFYTQKKREILDAYDQLVKREGPVSPKEFFEIRQRNKGDIVGVYVIYNRTKDMYYVGQAKRLFFRLNQHFTGHGNGDVYADYKYGDEFLIFMVPLASSGFSDIDFLEKELIKKYDAVNTGYNRTMGNR